MNASREAYRRSQGIRSIRMNRRRLFQENLRDIESAQALNRIKESSKKKLLNIFRRPPPDTDIPSSPENQIVDNSELATHEDIENRRLAQFNLGIQRRREGRADSSWREYLKKHQSEIDATPLSQLHDPDLEKYIGNPVQKNIKKD